MDSVKLLKEEIEREELRVEERRNLLEKLKANAKDAARQRKQQAKAVRYLPFVY
jgi:regulator of sirC expression with transglutaminase-like and TPR domain